VSALLRLLCPSIYAESVSHVDIADLKRRGIRALLLDLDNTLVRWKGWDIPPEVAAWVKEALAQGMKMCVVSNTRSPKRLRQLSETLGIAHVKRGAKPRRGGFREALRLLDAQPSETAVIGDQVFTDILGGNRLGAFTVLVRPMHGREFFGTKISRLFERVVLRLLDRRGMLRRCGLESPAAGEHLTETDSQKKPEQ
jgi:HAD superfamily phosphatase (TIGR01668 family)